MELIILILNFCRYDINPSFDRFYCVEQMTECVSSGNEFEYCADYWE